MNRVSLLTKEMTERWLKAACENFERAGFLFPVLFLDVTEKGRIIHMLTELPNTPEQKQAYFAKIGAQYWHQGQLIREAVLLMESWMVLVQESPGAFRMQPSQHPNRKEVLVLIGRDAANTRSTKVIQSFTREPTNKLTWSKPMITVYNEPVKQENRVQGLLDDLFEANQRFVTSG
jgi:hypothetical protein